MTDGGGVLCCEEGSEIVGSADAEAWGVPGLEDTEVLLACLDAALVRGFGWSADI